MEGPSSNGNMPGSAFWIDSLPCGGRDQFVYSGNDCWFNHCLKKSKILTQVGNIDHVWFQKVQLKCRESWFLTKHWCLETFCNAISSLHSLLERQKTANFVDFSTECEFPPSTWSVRPLFFVQTEANQPRPATCRNTRPDAVLTL